MRWQSRKNIPVKTSNRRRREVNRGLSDLDIVACGELEDRGAEARGIGRGAWLHRQCESAPVIGPGAWLAEWRTRSRLRAFPWPDRPAFARAR